MDRDPELGGDTPLHVAGQAHYAILDAVRPGPPAETHDGGLVRSPLGTMVRKPVPPEESRKEINRAGELILAELAGRPAITLEQLRKAGAVNPAALHTAIIVLKQEGKIRVEGSRILRGNTAGTS
jgi:hypothetical protein